MIDFTLDRKTSLLHVRLLGPLAQEDFVRLAAEVDPYIEETGGLSGLLLEVARFPGWKDFGAAIRHFRFVRDHHRKIGKVAVVSDSVIGKLAEHITAHFISAEVKHFPADQMTAAHTWLTI